MGKRTDGWADGIVSGVFTVLVAWVALMSVVAG